MWLIHSAQKNPRFSSYQVNVTCCMCRSSNARKLHKDINIETHKHEIISGLVHTNMGKTLVLFPNVSHPHQYAKKWCTDVAHWMSDPWRYTISTMNKNHAFFHTTPNAENHRRMKPKCCLGWGFTRPSRCSFDETAWIEFGAPIFFFFFSRFSSATFGCCGKWCGFDTREQGTFYRTKLWMKTLVAHPFINQTLNKY